MSEEKQGSIKAYLNEDGEFVDSATGEKLDVTDVVKTHDVYITDAKTDTINQLATGIAIPQYRKKSWDYLGEVFDFKETTEQDIYKQIDVCNKLYRFEPVIGTAIDIMVDFIISKFEIITDNKELNKVMSEVYKNINNNEAEEDYLFAYPSGLYELSKEIASEWFVSGNVFPFFEKYENLLIDNKRYKVPLKIINLNPRGIKIERSKKALGAVTLKYLSSGVYSGDSDGNGTTINYSSNRGGFDTELSLLSNKDAEETLNHKFVYHVKRKASSYKKWGVPYLTRTFTAIKSKRKLRYLDDATIDGLVNYIVIFKIGSTDVDSPYHKVNANRLSAFKSLIQNPQASNMIVWPHDIDMIQVGPNGEVLNFKDKYDIVDRDIIRSLGVPPALIDGSGTNIQVTWISILALIERLNNVRDAISDYLQFLVKQISIKNNLDVKDIKVKWQPSNLRDEQTIKNLLLAFYDRGLLPIETILFEGGYDASEVVTLKKSEKSKDFNKLFVRPDLPYSPQNFNRNPDSGRPTDKTDTKESNVITGKYIENMVSEISSLYEELKDIRKIDDKIKNRILASFVRMKQYSNAFIELEYSFANIDTQKYKDIVQSYYKNIDKKLDSMLIKFESELNDNLLYLRKESVANYVVAGVFSKIQKEFEEFCYDSLRNSRMIIEIISEREKGNTKIILARANGSEVINSDVFFDKVDFDNIKSIGIKFE